jgi:hypothetical protein
VAGLLDSLLGQRAQVPGSTQQPGILSNLLDPAVAMPMAAALMGNQGNMQNFGNAFGVGGQALAQTRQTNQTRDWLTKNAPEFAQLLDSGMDPREVVGLYAKQRFAQTGGDPYKAAGGHIFDTRTQTWISPPDDQGPLETGLAPVMMRDPETGKTIYAQPTRDGRIIPSEVPEGYEPYDPFTKAEQTAVGTATGKGRGEAVASFESMSSKMPGLEYTVKQLDGLADQATYTAAGQIVDSAMKQAGMEPREAAIARAQYIAVVDNQVLPLLRDTFGAAFTQKEGETLRNTLGDPNKSPREKQAVLKAFIEQKRRDVEALAVQSGQQPASPSGGRLRFNPATGELE